MVQAQAERSPDAVAVSQGDRRWSYADLISRTLEVIRELQVQGLQNGDVVAVSGQRSFGLVVNMLAVLGSRGVMLPIDPNLPERRQQLLVEQAGARRLLWAGNRSQQADWMRSMSWAAALEVNSDSGRVAAAAASVPATADRLPEPLPDDPAYIFFTSGTTGMPKGVLGSQKGLSHFLTWQRETFRIGPGDRVGQLSNLSFDVVLRAVFLALVSGGTLCLPPESVTLAPDSVLPWLERERITLFHTVPSLVLTWLGDVPPGVTLRSLRRVFIAGEPLHDSLVRRWRASFPAAGEVVNLYGPTETTMVKFFYVVPSEPDRGVQPAGWPMPQTQALLLTEQGQLCGAGEVGENVVRTPFRTLGYLNAPEEQRKRFVPNPFRNDPADLLYRTGDRGRYRADGALEILGRLDYQVKIQGVRIEPDEVSAAITQHPRVKAGVVVAQQEPSREPVLVAYVVAPGLTAPELREYLGRELPAAMVPGVFVFLDRLPLTPNGKVDRQALPAAGRADSGKPFVAPGTALEQSLAGIWQKVLDRERVGLEDNFFELGGNSVRLAQVHGKLRVLLNRDLPITTLFQYPTIRALAGYLGQQKPKQTSGSSARQRAARQIAARAQQVTREE